MQRCASILVPVPTSLISPKMERCWPIFGLGCFSAARTQTGSQNDANIRGTIVPVPTSLISLNTEWFWPFWSLPLCGLYRPPRLPFDRFCVGLWNDKLPHQAKGRTPDKKSYRKQPSPNRKPGTGSCRTWKGTIVPRRGTPQYIHHTPLTLSYITGSLHLIDLM